MNHIQLIMLTSSFNFNWPDLLNKFFNYSAPAATVGDQLFSIDCFLTAAAPESDSDKLEQALQPQ